jgi:ribosomal protein S18
MIINDVHQKTKKKKGKEREKKNMYHSALATLTLNYIIFKNVEVFKNYISHKKIVKENIEYIVIFYSLK